jgi:hypothetical protein
MMVFPEAHRPSIRLSVHPSVGIPRRTAYVRTPIRPSPEEAHRTVPSAAPTASQRLPEKLRLVASWPSFSSKMSCGSGARLQILSVPSAAVDASMDAPDHAICKGADVWKLMEKAST